MSAFTNKRLKTIKYFFDIAELVSRRSKDPSTKIGAVITSPTDQIVSCGYNGFPTKYDDSPDNYLNKEFKYPRIVHAEMNAILAAAKFGISTDKCSIYVVPIHICNECAKAIIQAGIKNVYCRVDKNEPKWLEAFEISEDLFSHCNINFALFDTELNLIKDHKHHPFERKL